MVGFGTHILGFLLSEEAKYWDPPDPNLLGTIAASRVKRILTLCGSAATVIVALLQATRGLGFAVEGSGF